MRRLALWCSLAVLAIATLSAFIRLSETGPGCSPWPACFGQPLAAPAADATVGATAVARLAHRVVASATLLAVVLLVALCFSRRPWLAREGRIALTLLALALGLAVLGRFSTGARWPAVGIGNLLGGLLMFALCARLACRPNAGPALSAPWARAALVLLLMQITLGALVSTSYAGASCTGWADCTAALEQAAAPWQALDPWREPVFDAGLQPLHRNAAAVLWLHGATAVLTSVLLVVLALLAWRQGRVGAGATLLALLALQVSLGWLLAGSGLGLALAMAHNLVAALLLALVMRLQ
ncbi:MAG: COX15/CtaA family protein [Rubrivivax sp.]|nr:COX15/CtaA family protein [Rubrivivax sp.]